MVAPVGASTANARRGAARQPARHRDVLRRAAAPVPHAHRPGRRLAGERAARPDARRGEDAPPSGSAATPWTCSAACCPARLPERDDVSLAVRYQPSGVGAEVGGDWYDVLVLPSGALGVVIGDVIGHDLRSAARMAQARSALRAYASEGHDPSQVVQRLNRLLVQTDPDFMGTCCYVEVRPDQATVTCRAGGPPAAPAAPGHRPPGAARPRAGPAAGGGRGRDLPGHGGTAPAAGRAGAVHRRPGREQGDRAGRRARADHAASRG